MTTQLAAAPAAPVDPQAEQKIAAIARALGVDDPTDVEAIRAAFEALIKPMAIAQTAARRTLSRRELAICKEKKIDVAKYAKTRADIARR